MYIISKFKDYYDAGCSTGVDRDIKYFRERKELSKNEIPKEIADLYFFKFFEHHHIYTDNKNRHAYTMLVPTVIGFCEQLYPALNFGSEKIFYYANDQQKLINEVEYYENVKGNYNIKEIVQKIKTFYNTNSYSKLNDIFTMYNCPIFSTNHIYNYYSRINEENWITINPELKKYNFFKIKDVFTAFQELSMYVGGVLHRPVKPMIQVSDEVKIHKHGFDKYSFRKGKEDNG